MHANFSAMHHLTAHWVPPNERSSFVSAYLGGSIGVAIAYPIFGFIIKISSWEWVFHACGICGIIWYSFWLYYVSHASCFDLCHQTFHSRSTIHLKNILEFIHKRKNTFWQRSAHRLCEATTRREKFHGKQF